MKKTISLSLLLALSWGIHSANAGSVIENSEEAATPSSKFTRNLPEEVLQNIEDNQCCRAINLYLTDKIKMGELNYLCDEEWTIWDKTNIEAQDILCELDELDEDSNEVHERDRGTSDALNRNF